jgi:hypothetical protein
VRLIDPDCFDREDGIEEGSDRCLLGRGTVHRAASAFRPRIYLSSS